MVTASGDPRMAANSMSHRGSDGAEWIGQDPKIPASTDCHLEYLLDQPLVDGLLFTPDVMEHKWVVYVHQGMIIVVRTWQREVYVVASIEAGGDTLVVSRIRGHFMGTDDTPEFTIATFEYLMRAHCLREHYLVPLPSDLDLKSASVWCCSSFGNIAEYASFERPERQVPEQSDVQHLAAAHRGGPPRPASDRRSGCSGRAVDILDLQHNTPFTYAVNVRVIDDVERPLTLGADI